MQRLHRFAHIVGSALAMVLAGPGNAAQSQPAATLTVGATSSAVYAVSGQIEAVRQAVMAAQVAGRITAVPVANGQAVKAGQLLLRIDSTEASDGHAAAVAALAAAEAQLANATEEHVRARQLREKDYLSEAAMQRADAQLRTAQAQAAAQRSLAQAARRREGWYTLSAPYAGRITTLNVAVGDLAVPGRPLIAVYDPSALRATAQIPEQVAERLDPGGKVQASAAGRRQAVAVTSWQIVPAVDAGSRSVGIRVELDSAADLRPGQMLQLALPLREAVAALALPRSAVVRRSELTAVYVLDAKGGARLRQVRLGATTGESVEVLAGLSPGEQVIIDAVRAGGR